MKNKVLVIFLGIIITLTVSFKKDVFLLPIQPLAKLSLPEISMLNLNDSHNTLFRDLSLDFITSRQADVPKSSTGVISNNLGKWIDLRTSPIMIKKPFKILFNIDGQSNEYILYLVANDYMDKNTWWRDIRRINITYIKSDQSLVVDIRDGSRNEPLLIHNLTKPGGSGSFLLEIDDNYPEVIRIYDDTEKKILTINLSEIPNIKLVNGVFFDNVLSVGLGIPKKSQISLEKLLISY